jgi:hypothetical protein
MRRKSFEPSLKLYRLSDKQTALWNRIYLEGDVELFTQRERRTAFTLQAKFSEGDVIISGYQESDDLEFIFFSPQFAAKVGAAPCMNNNLKWNFQEQGNN